MRRSVQEALVIGGRHTVVLAPQHQQVFDLERDGLTHAKTVAEFLQSRSMPDGAIVIVDEAGQIGARQMLALLELAQAHGGRSCQATLDSMAPCKLRMRSARSSVTRGCDQRS